MTLRPLLYPRSMCFLRTSIHPFMFCQVFLFSQPIRTCNTFRASSLRKLRVKPSYRSSSHHSLTSCIFSAAYIRDHEKVLVEKKRETGKRGRKRDERPRRSLWHADTSRSFYLWTWYFVFNPLVHLGEFCWFRASIDQD